MMEEYFKIEDDGHITIIEESTDSKDIAGKIKAYIITFYEHTLKYTHNIEFQTTSWITTILRVQSSITTLYNNSNVSKKQINAHMEDLSKLYRDGMRNAAKKNPQVMNKYDVYKAFGSIESICDKNHVIEYLRSVANTIEAKEKLDSLL